MRSLVKPLVVLIAALISSAGFYSLANLNQKTSGTYYVPSGSVMIAHVKSDNISFFTFATNTSVGVIISIPFSHLEKKILQTPSTVNNSTQMRINASVRFVMTYHHYSIFEFNNVSLINILSLFGKNYSYGSSLIKSGIRIYATQLNAEYSMIGTLNAVIDSINAFLDNNHFRNLDHYIDQKASLSLWLNTTAKNTSVQLSLNSTENYTSLRVGSNNIMFLKTLTTNLSEKIPKEKLNILRAFVTNYTVNGHFLYVKFDLGFPQISFLLGYLYDLLTAGGLNVKNSTPVSLLL